ncbi:MAG TPA: M15 family metallopeptidase [Firmicutes bacterium]|jgi:D-alanyl-D-alanine carboxypeptidase|nr:M15 family metallopeptidase [Bacillota bacterium]
MIKQVDTDHPIIPNYTGLILKKQKNLAVPANSIEVLVNKELVLSAEYVPQDLVVPNIPFSFTEDLPKRKMRQEAARAVEMLFTQAEHDGLQLTSVSAYRSYLRQQEIFTHNSKVRGETEANKVSARPGESEHQTGLAIDVSAPAVDYQLIEEFGETKEGRWLRENAHKYGFIIRYPKGKEETTGYQYEPWHIRYVGREAALVIAAKRLTLEEYTIT